LNIFLHELKLIRKSTLIWTFSLAALAVLFLSLYPAFSHDVANVKKLLEGVPEDVRKAIGLSLADFFTVHGFYSYIFAYIMLAGSIQAMNTGLSILSKEVVGKTADFLFTKPVSRAEVLTAKLLAALTSFLFTNAFYIITAVFTALAVSKEPFSMRIFIMISATLFFIQLIFFSLGILISVAFPKIRFAIAVSLAIVFGFFIINMFESVFGDQTLRYITPYKYFESAYIIKNGLYETRFVILTILVIIAAITASYILYLKQDINTV